MLVADSGVGRALSNLVNGCLHTREEMAAVKAGGKNKFAPSLSLERESALSLVVGGLANLTMVDDTRGRLSEAHIPQLLVRILEQTRK